MRKRPQYRIRLGAISPRDRAPRGPGVNWIIAIPLMQFPNLHANLWHGNSCCLSLFGHQEPITSIHLATLRLCFPSTRNRIRHLPIVENEKVLGVISIGDLVKWVVSEQEETIEHLQNYISSKYPT